MITLIVTNLNKNMKISTPFKIFFAYKPKNNRNHEKIEYSSTQKQVYWTRPKVIVRNDVQKSSVFKKTMTC